ncbi:uncharacterized protein LOC118438700 isoform X1 [Folsomia candida]|uniref:uncharacterized protein LOC118435459 isoform X1 n=1 Tax=Folsomia candida TaxID=158441 RepID=UPI0016052301|nr:uncharacterized protein LOC118435459 isoform X1 [Folsomia candida]XP_035707457.1 uncharacterized protein LOC118435461 isoform X1 [Folsomia candida]XP_035715179.1 uncharacterized protein LOC118438700 isoform X1 [Folsomia candida]
MTRPTKIIPDYYRINTNRITFFTIILIKCTTSCGADEIYILVWFITIVVRILIHLVWIVRRYTVAHFSVLVSAQLNSSQNGEINPILPVEESDKNFWKLYRIFGNSEAKI